MATAQTPRAALYLRVSTDRQTTDNQAEKLEAVAAARGWSVVSRYEDAGISGAKRRDQRPGLDAMLKDAARRRFDVVMVWAIDRLGRSLVDLLGTIHELESARVDLYVDQQAIDTTSPSGRAMFQMMGVFAEFERAMIRARVRAGMDRARAIGRIPGRTINPEKLESVRSLLASGSGVKAAARKAGVGTSVAQRLKREMTVAAE